MNKYISQDHYTDFKKAYGEGADEALDSFFEKRLKVSSPERKRIAKLLIATNPNKSKSDAQCVGVWARDGKVFKVVGKEPPCPQLYYVPVEDGRILQNGAFIAYRPYEVGGHKAWRKRANEVLAEIAKVLYGSAVEF